jgi:ParB family chromosome partitioning protein
VKLYAKEVETQQIMVKRADFSHERLTFIAESFRELLADESFKTLLKRENLDSLPKHLAMRLSGVDI